jgi:hypothetical protein
MIHLPGALAADSSMNGPPPITTMNQSWQPPPELLGSLPRQFKWKSSGIISIVLAVAIFVAGLLFFAGTWYAAHQDHLLNQEGQVGDAIVTRTWTEPAKQGFTYMVAYRFSIEGKSLNGEAELSQESWEGLRGGSHTPVRYVPGQPENNRLSLADQTTFSYFFPFMVFAFSTLMLVRVVYPLRKERRLLRHGQVAPALVISTPSRIRPRFGYVTTYEFQLPDGAVRTGSTQQDRLDQRGDWITILYDPNHPRRSDIYPTRFARIQSYLRWP